MRHYDVIVIGAGPGGIFATYELAKNSLNFLLLFLKPDISYQEESVLLMVTRFLTASIVKAALL